jgi:serine O-acetyltransferase
MNTHGKEDLVQIVDNIMASYKEIGGINHIMGPNLPSRNSVGRILNEIESLIFPGFVERIGVDQASLAYHTAECVYRIAKDLIPEANKSFQYKQRADGEELNPQLALEEATEAVYILLKEIPNLRRMIRDDVQALYMGDPAAKSIEEVILSYPATEAILVHRVAHILFKLGVPLIPRMMSEHVHSKTGIDIHPGATIGRRFCIDHGTGIVIGETCIIGDDVKVYHGVTLGALSVKKEEAEKKRHPTIENGVTIYPGATILGGDTKVGTGTVIGGNTWLTSSVPAYSVIITNPKEQLMKQRGKFTPDYQI